MLVIRELGAPAPYQQIRQILRDEVIHEMNPGDRIAPERELAKRFSANRATISRAISSLVQEGLLFRRVGCGTFVTGGEGYRIRAKTFSVGLVMPHIQGRFPADIMQSAVGELRNHSYKAVLFDSDDSIMSEASELERLIREGMDGALIMPVEALDNASLFNRLITMKFPLVFIDRKPYDLNIDYVGSDHYWGAYEATKRLIEHGHTRIAHFTSLSDRLSSSINDRRLGYEQALKDHGIDVDQELICPPALFAGRRLEFKHMLAFLRQGKQPVTALFALNDLFAFVTIAACRELGLSVPEDLEIATFFDVGDHPAVDWPVIKVVQRQEEIGSRAVELLLSRIEGKVPEDVQSIIIRPDIIDCK